MREFFLLRSDTTPIVAGALRARRDTSPASGGRRRIRNQDSAAPPATPPAPEFRPFDPRYDRS